MPENQSVESLGATERIVISKDEFDVAKKAELFLDTSGSTNLWAKSPDGKVYSGQTGVGGDYRNTTAVKEFNADPATPGWEFRTTQDDRWEDDAIRAVDDRLENKEITQEEATKQYQEIEDEQPKWLNEFADKLKVLFFMKNKLPFTQESLDKIHRGEIQGYASIGNLSDEANDTMLEVVEKKLS